MNIKTMKTEKNENGVQNKISVFKQVYSLHKRQGKNPNRIDDLLGNNIVIDVDKFGNGIGDQDENDTMDANERKQKCQTPKPGDPVCFGENLVVCTKSILYIPIDGQSSKIQERCCSCVSFREFPGVYLYPKALDIELQLRLAYEAVTEYCELGPTTTIDANVSAGDPAEYASHRTNIDLLPPKTHERVNQLDNKMETMWNLWKHDKQVQSTKCHRPEKKAKKDNQQGNQSNNYYRRFSKLSWATMGYHYDWTERSYHPQKKSKMPDLVARVSTLFATASLQSGTSTNGFTNRSSFTPSASIVNFYTTKSTMGGHRDDLEDKDAMDKPIVSISLGLPGIFILGGPMKDEFENNEGSTTPPHPVRALLLRPGDVLVMGGASRLNYHAMARVLPHEAALEYDQQVKAKNDGQDRARAIHEDEARFATISSADLSLGEYGESDNEEREFLQEYLRHHRVNINVRQVYPDE